MTFALLFTAALLALLLSLVSFVQLLYLESLRLRTRDLPALEFFKKTLEPALGMKTETGVLSFTLLKFTFMLLVSILLTTTGHAGLLCMSILVGLSGAWLLVGLKNYSLEAKAWGKKMFLFSLIVNLGISLAISIGSVTP